LKKLGLLLGGVGLMLVLVMPPAQGNQPALRFTEDATGGIFGCETTTYAIVSGEFAFVIHHGRAASGNNNFTVTVTPRNVLAQDKEGNLYAVRGVLSQGGVSNTIAGVGVFTFTEHFQIISMSGGGPVDSVNVTFHVTELPNNFVLKEIDVGTCAP
jgi:hypothetical protein